MSKSKSKSAAIRPMASASVAGTQNAVSQPTVAELWDSFWFTPQCHNSLRFMRTLVCATCIVWLVAVAITASTWFGHGGFGDANLDKKLSVSTEGVWPARFRITALWMTSNPMVIQAWCAVVALLAAASAIGIGGRIINLVLFVAALLTVHRLTWATSSVEPLMVASLGYLAIAPPQRAAKVPSWTTGFAIRLIQCHLWIVLAAALAAMLSSNAWWQGEAVWHLAAAGQSIVLNPNWLADHVLITNAITYIVLIAMTLAVGLLWNSHLMKVGIVAGWAVALAYALVANQLLYGALIAALLLAFFEKQSE